MYNHVLVLEEQCDNYWLWFYEYDT